MKNSSSSYSHMAIERHRGQIYEIDSTQATPDPTNTLTTYLPPPPLHTPTPSSEPKSISYSGLLLRESLSPQKTTLLAISKDDKTENTAFKLRPFLMFTNNWIYLYCSLTRAKLTCIISARLADSIEKNNLPSHLGSETVPWKTHSTQIVDEWS